MSETVRVLIHRLVKVPPLAFKIINTREFKGLLAVGFYLLV